MGSNAGSGLGNLGGGDMSGGLQGNGSGQPNATEYTLQGVMRFLQTEWHRHERDRNAWEIEKQEMKGRIAALEGSVRRADATQKALKKYVAILEKKVKEQAAQLKAPGSALAHSTGPEKPNDAAAVAEQSSDNRVDEVKDAKMTALEAPFNTSHLAADEESQISDLRAFLEQCRAEFTYLMVTPANPTPPRERESPRLPLMEDMPEDDFPMASGQQQQQQQQQQQKQQQQQQQQQSDQYIQPMRFAPNMRKGSNQTNHSGAASQQSAQGDYAPMANAESQAAHMVRSNAEMGGGLTYSTTPVDWAMQQGQQLPASDVPEHRAGRMDSTRADFGSALGGGDLKNKTEGSSADAWDFNEGPASFPEQSPSLLSQPMSNRPDTDVFPAADSVPKSPGRLAGSHRRKGSMSRRRSAEHELSLNSSGTQGTESGSFKLRFGLRGHLDTVRTVIFSGGGSPGEPEICTAGDDGLIKRFHIPRTASYGGNAAVSDLDVQADFTHRGHHGAVLCLASWSAAPNFSTGGRAQGDGWIFSGGQDNCIRVWERGRVDPKATVDAHLDAVWALCVLPASLGTVFGQVNPYGPPDRILLASGAADGTVRIWAVSAPPQPTSPQPAATGMSSRRGAGGGGRVRGNSVSSGSGFPSSPQPTMSGSSSPFLCTLVRTIVRANSTASPTSITTLSGSGENFVVSYSDATIVVFDTRTGEEIGTMASLETYDGTVATSVNTVVATTVGLDQPQLGDEDLGGNSSGGGPTGGGRAMAGSGVEGVIISGHEDRFIRFFDANSGQCTYNMLAHPAAIASLSLSPDGRELVSAGHDASLRFWSLEKRSCTQEVTAHRIMRGEGVCAVVWSQDGRWVVSGGGDGVVKVFAR